METTPARLRGLMYRVHFNVSNDSVKLVIGEHQPIVAFVLPKRASGQAQDAICLSCGKPFQRLHNTCDRHLGRDQHMHVIGHDHEAMEQVLRGVPVLNRFSHHANDIGSLMIERAGRSVSKKTVHREECLARRSRAGKRPICGESAVEAPGDEQRPADFVDMGQPASVEMRHKVSGVRFHEFSEENSGGRFPIGLQVANLPHIQ
jgi:hypothetical protein